MKKFTKAISAIAVASALAATVCVAASAEKAGITFQMAGNYVFRDTIAQEKVIVYDAGYLEDSGEVGQYPDVEDDIYDLEGSFTDAEITGDGTYTVSVQHATANMSGDSSIGYNMIKLGTNINTADYPDLKVTINKVTIAGQELTPTTTVFSAADETLQCEKQSGKFDTTDLGFTDTDLVISLINTYGDSVVDASLIDADGNITVEFTVEGMGAAAAEDPAESETPAESEAPTTGDTSKPSTNTGAEGIALAAGVAVLATGAAIVAKKRK